MQTDKLVSYKNSDLFYRCCGQGKHVMLLHGFGEDGTIWNGIAKVLQEKFCIIIPDIPGSGKSGILREDQEAISLKKKEDKQDKSFYTSIDDYAEVVKFILDAESIDACTIIGHSMGGYIALAFAEKYPERLNSLGLLHSSVFADDEEKIQTRLKAIDFIRKNGSQAFLKNFIPGLFNEDFNKEHFDEVEKLINAGINFNPDALIQYHEAMIRRPDRSNILKQFLKPVLIIAGEKDKVIPLNISLRQSHLPLISHFHILPGAAHMGMLEEKGKMESLMSSFISNLYFLTEIDLITGLEVILKRETAFLRNLRS